MVEAACTRVYKKVLARAPAEQGQKINSIGVFFFKEARKLETEITGPASCLVRYRYQAGAKPTRAICQSLTGFWSRSIELSGASNVKAAHPKCFATGGDC